MIRYGTNPIAWSNDDDPSIGDHISLKQCLQEAANIGFDGIENGHKFPFDPGQLQATLKPYGLDFISAWTGLHLLHNSVQVEIARIQPELDRLKAMGCTVCIACETSNTIHGDPGKALHERPVLAASQWAEWGAKIEAVAQHCAGMGLPLAYHPHMGTIVQTPEEYDLLMTHTGPATHLLLDTGHCFLGGGDPNQMLVKYVHRLAHLHVKNVRPMIMRRVWEQKLSFLDAVKLGVFTVPGDIEGTLDFRPVMQQLVHGHYSGWIVIEAEQDAKVRMPMHYQTLGLNTLKTLATELGLK